MQLSSFLLYHYKMEKSICIMNKYTPDFSTNSISKLLPQTA